MRPPQQELAYTFPDEDLMHSLIDFYFSESNTYLPLLHRPTFDKAVAEALHLRDDSFAVNLLLVCAIGARYSNDPRVLLDGHIDWRSSGWKWFQQVQLIRHNLLDVPSLYDIQFYCVSPGASKLQSSVKRAISSLSFIFQQRPTHRFCGS
jgi:hypothetical protein